jgi:hypothetical protein
LSIPLFVWPLTPRISSIGFAAMELFSARAAPPKVVAGFGFAARISLIRANTFLTPVAVPRPTAAADVHEDLRSSKKVIVQRWRRSRSAAPWPGYFVLKQHHVAHHHEAVC